MTKNGQTNTFTLTGFTQQGDFRVFTFVEIMKDRPRVSRTVRADLTLIRRYKILVQDLPLLCRDLLQQSSETETLAELTFTEEEMQSRSATSAIAREEALRKRKAPRNPAAGNSSGWRTAPPIVLSSGG